MRTAAVLAATLFLAAAPARADLAKYLARQEPDFAWKVRSSSTLLGSKIYEIELVSQKWHDIVWKHDLLVVLPPKAKPGDTMLLWNQGGTITNTNRLLALDLAGKTQAPVAFLYGVPNQPLFGKLKEDALIAETFVRYLKTKDSSWPLLFPMTKSLVKAMDALQAFAKKEWEADVKHFVVTGASKRGWTTWLTGASDPRVKAIAPLVIDTLNMQKQTAHQLASYGAYSEMIRDYTARGLVPPPKTEEAQALWKMVDPYVYRDKVTMPKMIINGANDPYWTQDALNLYWDDLVGPKAVLYVPNAGHNLAQNVGEKKTDTSRAIQTLAAFARSQIHGTKMAKLEWKHAGGDDAAVLTTKSDAEPKAVRLWTADAPTKDFRKATWKEAPAKLGETKIGRPATGYRVVMMECEYDMGSLRYFLSTQVRILPAK